MKYLIHLLFILIIILIGCSKDDEPKPAQLNVSSTHLDFGADTTTLTFKISNPGDDPLEWTLIPDQTWITVSPTSGVTYDLEAEIVVQIDRSGLVPADYSGTVSVSSNVGDASVDISMKITYGISKIVFSRTTYDEDDEEYYGNVYVMNYDGSGQQQITQLKSYNFRPCWSPDGQNIVFISDRYGGDNIFKMSSSGLQATQLSFGDEEEFVSWSPDGLYIAFDRYIDNDVENYDAIFIMKNDGTDQIQLTYSDQYIGSFCWSKDGKKIYYASNLDGDYDIYVMNADGSNSYQITQDEFDNDFPTISLDNKIVFASDRDGDAELFIMNTDGTNIQQITFNDVDDYYPCCSKVENKIAFVSNRDGDAEIFTINMDGTGLQQLTQNEVNDFRPNW